jgi:CBS-domain-containing membrane protein
MPMQAKDIMTVNVISVSETTPVHEIVQLMLKYHISGVPVIDDVRNVVGIVSEGDLLVSETTSAGRRRPWWLDTFLGERVGYEKAHGRTASEIMTSKVVTVDEDTPVHQIAELLERHHIKRVPVLSGGKLAGIVSRANLLHGLANTIVEHHEPGAEKDRELRRRLMKSLLDNRQLETVLVNITVQDGNVRLWGMVESVDQAAAVGNAAKALSGVKSVENNLGTGPMSGVPI